MRLPWPSTPMRAPVCAALPGSSEILVLASQAPAPEVSALKKMSGLPFLPESRARTGYEHSDCRITVRTC